MSQKWVALTDRIVGLTQENKLTWRETSDPDTFQVVIGKTALEVEQMGFGDDFQIRIRDSSGKLVDRFDDDDLQRISRQPYSGLLSEMFNLIRRQLSGTEDVIDDLLSELENK